MKPQNVEPMNSVTIVITAGGSRGGRESPIFLGWLFEGAKLEGATFFAVFVLDGPIYRFWGGREMLNLGYTIPTLWRWFGFGNVGVRRWPLHGMRNINELNDKHNKIFSFYLNFL